MTSLFFCTVCNGRGWVLRGTPGVDHADICVGCNGRGRLSAAEIAASIGEEPQTFQNLLELRCRPSTARRMFTKLMDRWVCP
jgi:hypothetical protein